MSKFSVITPFHVWNKERRSGLERAARSLENQTFKDFEWVAVNDGSPQTFSLPAHDWVKLLHKDHGERVIATNFGLENSGGEWICFLDSDDEFEPNYLERVDEMIKANPDYKLFNFGSRMVHKDGGESLRGAFKPQPLEVGHEVFGGGNIVNGTFVFHRSVYEDLGAFPPAVVSGIDCRDINYGGIRDLHMNTPYDFSAYAQIEFPEIRQFFMVDHVNEPNKIIKELGNPWGNDFYLFYKYTRKYHSLPFDDYLYVVHLK